MTYGSAVKKHDGVHISPMKAVKIAKPSSGEREFKYSLKKYRSKTVESRKTNVEKQSIKRKDISMNSNERFTKKYAKKAKLDVNKNKNAQSLKKTEAYGGANNSDKVLKKDEHMRKILQKQVEEQVSRDNASIKESSKNSSELSKNVDEKLEKQLQKDIVELLSADEQEQVNILQMLMGDQNIQIDDEIKLSMEEATYQFNEGDTAQALKILSKVFEQMSSQSTKDVENIDNSDGNLKIVEFLELMKDEDFVSKFSKASDDDIKESLKNTSDKQIVLEESSKLVNRKSSDMSLDELANKLNVQVLEKEQGTNVKSHIKNLEQSGLSKEDVEIKNANLENSTMQTSTSLGENAKPAVTDTSQMQMKLDNLSDVSNIKQMSQVDMADRIQTAKNIMNQILDGTRSQIDNLHATENLTIRLKPEELGQVDLKISVEKGILMAEFQVENQIVKETLESNMSDLKQALQEKGYGVEGLEVSVSQQKEQGSKQELFENSSNNRRYFLSEDEDIIDFDSVNKSLMSLQSTFEYLG